MISIRCQCGGQLTVSPRLLGKPTRCPACRAVARPVAPWGPVADDGTDFFGRLIIMVGPERVGEQILLGGPGPIDVGKQPGNGIVLTGELVSRTHARLARRDRDWVLHDCGSTNGTGVNGKRVGDAVLHHGDRLRVGEYEFLFVSIAAQPDDEAEQEGETPEPKPPPPTPPAVRPTAAPPVFPTLEQATAPAPDTAAAGGRRLALTLALGAFAAVAVLGLIAYWAWPGPAFVFTTGALVKKPPAITRIKHAQPSLIKGYTITPLADISLDALVLGKASYQDALADLAPWNLAVGWGAMSDPAVVGTFTLLEEARGVQISFRQRPDIPWDTLKTQFDAFIVVPANDAVLRQIERLTPGRVATLRGKLINLQLPAGQVLTSDPRRTAFDGVPDVIWLDGVEEIAAKQQPPKAQEPKNPSP